MKDFKNFTKPKIKPKEPKSTYSFILPPTPVPKRYNPYQNICRVMPIYVVSNYELFELITCPKQKVTDWEAYVLRIKEKIACMKADSSV